MTTESLGDDERLDAFLEKAGEALGCLCERYGFSPPSAEIDRRAATVTVTFAKGSVAIEAIHDLREGDVELKVARLKTGRKPDAYQVDQLGRRCRASLVEILVKRGVRSFGLKRPETAEAYDQRINRLLCQYADLLEAHAADILSGSAEALDSLAVSDSSHPHS